MYQVYHQLSPWSKLYIPGPSVTPTKCTRSLINHHPGPSCMTQGLLLHVPSVPGLIYIIILVHICMTQGLLSHVPSLSSTITLVQVVYPRAFCHTYQVYQVSYKSSPWSKLHDPGPSVTCTKCTRSLIHHHPGPYLHDPGPSITCTKSIINYHPGPSCISQGLLSHLPSVPGLL